MKTPPNMNHCWSVLMMEELHRLGVTTVCIAPGSRSTPLTWAAAEHEDLETVVHFDERGLAFHALGIAKASGNPVAIVCTSGSAVANLLPAVVEAYMSHVPLILLTADRPFELVDCGANQTIKQPGIFGDYTRHAVNLPTPDVAIAPNVLLSTIDHAASKATGSDAGPVHINCSFREPLAPDADGVNLEKYLEPLGRWVESGEPWTEYSITSLGVTKEYDAVNEAKRAILILGESKGDDDGLGIAMHLSGSREDGRNGIPLVADIGNYGRFRDDLYECLISYADQILLTNDAQLFDDLDIAIHIGGPIVSKRIQEKLRKNPPKKYIRISRSLDTLDPDRIVTDRIVTDRVQHALLYQNVNVDQSWRDKLVTASQKIGSFLAGQFSGDEITEPGVVRAVTQTECNALFLGNSMPIRDADMYGDPGGYVASVYVSRGASGIDGNIATVAGIARETGQAAAVLGDLAVLHDLNSLALLQRANVTLVVINNGGGGIFSMLPIAEHGALAEEFFGTPHSLTFEFAAAQFKLAYHHPGTMTEFREAYESALASGVSSIIEVTTDRAENAAFHKQLQQNLIEFMNNDTE